MARATIIKDPVKLREKVLKDGTISLYLDIYHNKRRSYEYLNIYLTTGKSAVDKQQNKEKVRLAQTITAHRVLEIQNGVFGLVPEHKKSLNFIEYFKSLVDKRVESGINSFTWLSVYRHLKTFRDYIPINNVDDLFLEDFKNYLLTKVHQNSAHPYFNKVKSALYQAVRSKLIIDNPADKVVSPKVLDSKREYLNLEELRAISKEDCKYPILKSAFLFSALTGLRWSDIQKLRWSEIKQSKDNGWSIEFTQKKTDGVEYLPISDQAVALIGDRNGPEERVFKGLKYSAYHNVELLKWMMKAGITKHITFHCARHSFATLQMTMGTDIFTVSKLLGHRDLKTTQIYAKIIDQTKVSAVNNMPNIAL
jgi:integrase